MTHLDTFEAITADTLANVTGGASWWQNTKNAAGGLTAGLLHGAEGKVDQVARFGDTSSQWTKGGFETGAALNMATGNLGGAVSAVADKVLPSTYNK
jgi:hypothetical protein